MYKVYCDGYILHDPERDDRTCLVMNGKVQKVANCADGFVFTIYPQNTNADRISKMTSKIEVVKDGETIFTGRPVSYTEGWNGQKTWQCEGVFALLNDTVIRPYRYTGTVRGYLQMLLNQHNAAAESEKQFTLGTVTVTDPNDTIVRSNSDYTSTMKELLDKTVGHMGGYLVTTVGENTITLDYIADSTDGTGQSIGIAKNLIDFKRDQDGTKIATALIPLGAKDEETGERVTIASVNSGNDYIVDNEAAAEYGLIFATEKWDDVTIPANLLRKAQAKLQELKTCVPRITLTALDLSIVDQNIEPIRLLDYVTVIDNTHQASGRYLITERTYNISNPENDKITFGGEQATISGQTARNRQEASKESEQAYNDSRSAMEEAIERATDRITGEDGGHVKFKYDDQTGELEQILIMDTHDEATATKIWRWNLSGLGYSSNGGEHYTIAITANGEIVADFITTGTLNASRVTVTNLNASNISTGTLSADRIAANSISVSKLTGSISSGGWVIDLDNGTLTVGNISASNITTGTLDASIVTITNLNASNITTGTLSADRIAANSISVSKLTGSISSGGWVIDLENGTLTVGVISADDITTGTLRSVKINNGSGTFSVDETGHLTASSGEIGSLQIYQGGVISGIGNARMGVGYYSAFWAGSNIEHPGQAPFQVSYNGELTATDATIVSRNTKILSGMTQQTSGFSIVRYENDTEYGSTVMGFTPNQIKMWRMGYEKVSIDADNNGGSLNLSDSLGNERASIGVDANGGSLHLSNSSGNEVISMDTSNGGWLALCDSSGNEVISMGATSGITVSNAAGTVYLVIANYGIFIYTDSGQTLSKYWGIY